MKIHGTAKGAALSTKDFGVAFGGAAAPVGETFTMNGTGDSTDMSGTFNHIGQQFHADSTEGALLIDETVTKVQFYMKKTATGITDTTLTCSWYNSSGGDPVKSDTEYNTVTDLTESYQFREFLFNYTVEDGDFCAVTTSADITSGQAVRFEAGGNTYDNTNMKIRSGAGSGTWANRTRDCYSIWTY